jgi:hypothetical protein
MSTAVTARKRSHQTTTTATAIPMREKPTANIELGDRI